MPPRGIGVHVAAEGRGGSAVRELRIAVEITHQRVEPAWLSVALGLFRVQIADQHIERIDRRHAMTLAHHPAASLAGQAVQCQIGCVTRHHVQRATGVAFRRALEILRRHRAAIKMNTLGIGHVSNQPEAGIGQQVER